jgi:hypothetical protein
MGHTARILDEVRGQIAPSDETLKAVRERRGDVLDVAKQFPGVLRTYFSGSVAHGTANDDTDADCGVVLDRRSYPDLGPDVDGPSDVLEKMRVHLRDGLSAKYPDISFRLTKRAIEVSFKSPLADESDPKVDLIVTLTRSTGDGLWIPNTKTDGWDASHPEKHTELLVDKPKSRRVTRARIIRLGKCWNKTFTSPGLISFNIEALSLESVTEETEVPTGLAEFFEYAGAELKKRLTPDPAGVSGSIRLLEDRDLVVGRLERAGSAVREALDNDDDEDKVREALSRVFRGVVQPPADSNSKEALAAALTRGNQGVSLVGGTITVGGTGARAKDTRSYGAASR